MKAIRLLGESLRTLRVGALGVFLIASAWHPAGAQNYTLVGWNNLGMHCTDSDFSVLSLLPPYNTIHAQLVDPQGHLVTNPVGITVTYQAVADPDGSINTTSQGKTNFWQHVDALFGVTLPEDVGLTGLRMPGAGNQPQPMSFDAANGWFIAEGIPLVPYDDAHKKNTYPMMRLVARASGGNVLATADIVLPVSDEMDCTSCHASNAPPPARPAAGWVNDPDPQRDFRLNILRKHDDRQAGDPTFLAALSGVGYNPAGLYATATADGKAILCASCHSSVALGTPGQTGVAPLTQSMHGFHANVSDPVTGLAMDSTNNRSACYRCHPGSVTRCLRGVMGASIASDGTLAMQCQSCHGTMSAVGSPARTGWLNEPVCQSCHTGTATANSGRLRYLSVFDTPGHERVAVDQTFATTPDAPAPGLSLFRFSKGHGGLTCEACHGSTHAEFPSAHRNDNIESIALQGHEGMLAECDSCHVGQPATVAGGPHGMHPLGQSWVSSHKSVVGEGGDPAPCRVCHGTDYRGTVLSRAKSDRILSGEFGNKQIWRGFQIGCYTCHLGPNNDDTNPNRAAVVSNGSASTSVNTPISIRLTASDADHNALTLRIVSQPEHGTVGLSGTLADYFPEPSFVGTDSFTFAAWDGSTDSSLGTVAVNVGGAGTCTYVISPTNQELGVTGGIDSLTVATSLFCGWTAASTASWITVMTGSNGRGNGSVGYSVTANPGADVRTGMMTIAGQTFTVIQAGSNAPDLTGNWTSLTQTCKSFRGALHCRVKGKLIVVNQGPKKTGRSKLRFFLSSDAILSADDPMLGRQHSVRALGVGKGVTKSLNVRLPAGQNVSGMFVIAEVDASHIVAETNEDNNLTVFGPVP
jgi:hypothetical protein